jgi:transcriptional regulator with XRE-family HTH domain
VPITTTRRARALAAALRELRERSGMTSRDLSAQLGLSHSTVSHWETGKRIPTTEDVASVLGAVGVNGDERGRILNLARHATDENWLTHGIPGLPEQLAGAVECEQDATAISHECS